MVVPLLAHPLRCATLVVALAPGMVAAEPTPTPSRAARRTPVVEVFERTRDAVVNIRATVEVENYDRLFPDDLFADPFGGLTRRKTTRRYTSLGSGFVIHPDGFVVTNAHVVMRAAGQEVIFADGTKYEADRIAIDEKHDLAVLKIKADRSFPAITLGRSDDLMVGETVIAIGNPLGYHHTVTAGIISATDRTLTFREDVEYKGLIQTDASINRGNSGGPLLNVLGELIGINTAIRGDAQNIGFAIPVDALRILLPEMLSIERRKRLEIGLQLSWRGRVYVAEARGPAAEAGIEPGDELLSVDGKPIKHDVDFYIYLLRTKPSSRLILELKRNEQRFQATLRPRPIPIPDGAKLLQEKFGLAVQPLTPDQAAEIHPRLKGGLLITAVEQNSPADRARFRRGHLIVQIGNYFPEDLEEVGLLLEGLERGQKALFRVLEVRRWSIWVLQGELVAR